MRVNWEAYNKINTLTNRVVTAGAERQLTDKDVEGLNAKLAQALELVEIITSRLKVAQTDWELERPVKG